MVITREDWHWSPVRTLLILPILIALLALVFPSRLSVFPTLEALLESQDAARYDRSVYIQTILDQYLAMTTYGDSNYRSPYRRWNNNCGDLANDILGAGGIKGGGSILGTPRPNSKYNEFSMRPSWNHFETRFL